MSRTRKLFAVALATVGLGSCAGDNTLTAPTKPLVPCWDGSKAPNSASCPVQPVVANLTISAVPMYKVGTDPDVELTVRVSGPGTVTVTSITVSGNTIPVSGNPVEKVVVVPEDILSQIEICAKGEPLQENVSVPEKCIRVWARWVRATGQSILALPEGDTPPTGQMAMIGGQPPIPADALGRWSIPIPSGSPTTVQLDLLGSPEYFGNRVLATDVREYTVLRALPRVYEIGLGVYLGQKVPLDLVEATTRADPSAPASVTNSSLICTTNPGLDGSVAIISPRKMVPSMPFAFMGEFGEGNQDSVRIGLSERLPSYVSFGQYHKVLLSQVQAQQFGFVIKEDPNLPASGRVDFLVYDSGTGEITGGQISFRFFSRRTIMHEGIHGLAFCHGRTPGIMNVSGGGFSLSSPSPEEVAHIEAAYRVSERDLVSHMNAIAPQTKWVDYFGLVSSATAGVRASLVAPEGEISPETRAMAEMLSAKPGRIVVYNPFGD